MFNNHLPTCGRDGNIGLRRGRDELLDPLKPALNKSSTDTYLMAVEVAQVGVLQEDIPVEANHSSAGHSVLVRYRLKDMTSPPDFPRQL